MISERIIMGLMVFITCILPLILSKIRSITFNKKIMGHLHDLAQQNDSNINVYDQWNSYAIAISTKENKLFWITIEKEEENKVLDISSFATCTVVIEDQINNVNLQKQTGIGNISLELTGNEVEERICFYNDANDGKFIANELTLAKKWCRIIEQRLAFIAGQHLSIK